MDATRYIAPIWLVLFAAASLQAQSPTSADVHGEPLPTHAVGRLGSDRFVTRERVESLAFTFDGSLLAGADYLDAYLWDAKTGKRLLHLPNGGGRVALSPDGRWLVCGHYAPLIIPRPIQIWDVKLNKAIDVPIPKDAGGFGFSPDGKTLAITFRQKMDVHLYDVATWKVRQKLGEGDDAEQCHDVVFSLDGRFLAVAHTAKRETVEQGNKWRKPTGTVVLWDLEKKTTKREFLASQDDAKFLAFTQKGKTLFAMSKWEAQGWDIDTGKPSPWQGEAWHNPVAFDREGKVCAVSQGLFLFEFSTKKIIHALADKDTFAGVLALSGNGKRFAAVPVARFPSPVIHVWDIDGVAKKVPRPMGHSGSINAVSFSPDGKLLATASHDDGTFCLWDANSKTFTSATAFRDGSAKAGPYIWITGGSGFTSKGLLAGGQLWDIAPAKPLRRPWTDNDFPRDLATKATSGTLSANEKWGLGFKPGPPTAAGDPRIDFAFWDVATNSALLKMDTAVKAKDDQVEEFLSFWAFASRSPRACINRGYSNGPEHIIVQKQRLEIWDFAAKKRITAMARGHENLRAVAFSPDDSFLAVFAHPPRLEIVHLGLERTVWKKTWNDGNPNHTLRNIAFAPHGHWIAAMSSERSVELLETWTGEKIMEYEGHLRPITALAFSPTAQYFATGSDDTTALIRSAMPSATPLPERWGDDEYIWQGLIGSTETAYRIIGPLIANTERAILLFEKRLKPAQSIDAEAIQRDLRSLGSASYGEREAAMKRLRAIGRYGLPALQLALKQPSSLEVKRRLDDLNDNAVLTPSPDELRRLRAVLVLELLNSTKAMPILQRMAQGDRDAEPTRQAIAAIERLNKTNKR